jgi:lactate dehydrogenase-like 2-hydroxyacid dehydrogenase
METILVTKPEFRKAEAVFRDARDLQCEPVPPEENALAGLVARHGVRAVIVGVAPYLGALYEALASAAAAHGRRPSEGDTGRPGLPRPPAIIARFGVGHDSIDKALARQHGIVVTNTPGVLDESVAEHTLWLMGCLARRIARLDACVRAGEFAGQTGTELHGKTLGIVGLGNIGRRVAAMAHFGFGMRVMACGRRATADGLAQCGLERYTDNAEEVFRQSDFLSLHLRSDAGTRHFVNAARLAWLKPGAMIINTARGAVLDEAALFDALAGGRLAGAALDVFEREPYQPVEPGKDLRKLENAVLTPHIGSNTREANARMAETALGNVRHFLAHHLDRLTRVDH